MALHGPESPLNKLADSLPGFLLELQGVKLEQDAERALNRYRMAALSATIEKNRLAGEANDILAQRGIIERGQIRREKMIEMGEEAARAVYGDDPYEEAFGDNPPPQTRKMQETAAKKESAVGDAHAKNIGSRAIKEYDRLFRLRQRWQQFQKIAEGKPDYLKIIEQQFPEGQPIEFTPEMQGRMDQAAEITNKVKGYDPRTLLDPVYDKADMIQNDIDPTAWHAKNTQTGEYEPVEVDLETGTLRPR